ncbi:MAG: ferredoxin [Candidatus Bathyarchaeota archaeon B63]|nr:MAG: ferredoxin [Candidatus Bathyarchaeota archaeon B63]
MAIKLTFKETESQMLIERQLYVRHYSLMLDKERCIGCEICMMVCPREAIEIVKPKRVEGEKLKRPTIRVDEKKCSFCGICDAICPFEAFTLKINGEELVPVLEMGTFPNLIRRVSVDEARCPVDCDECAEACPFDLIKVSADDRGMVHVEVDVDHCPGCRLCELECPEGAITVRRIFSGIIKINQDKCPDGCRDCVDVCPIPGVLTVSSNGKVEVNDYCCIYCGSCRIVCPVEEALTLKRTEIAHSPIQSGAWNIALEKLTSTHDLAKELTRKRTFKVIDSTKRRVG